MSRTAVLFLVFAALGLSLLLAWLGIVTLEANLLGWFLLLVGLLYFCGIFVVYWVRRIQFWGPRADGEIVREEREDRSFWFIVTSMIVAFYLPPLEYLFFAVTLPRTVWMQILGIFLLSAGSALFIWARRTLGKFYSGHVSVMEGQPLIMSGPYRFIRHPAYAGYLLLAIGLAVGYSSPIGLFMTAVLLLPSIMYRLSVEDRLLAEHFGEAFNEYAGKTARLIPYIW